MCLLASQAFLVSASAGVAGMMGFQVSLWAVRR